MLRRLFGVAAPSDNMIDHVDRAVFSSDLVPPLVTFSLSSDHGYSSRVARSTFPYSAEMYGSTNLPQRLRFATFGLSRYAGIDSIRRKSTSSPNIYKAYLNLQYHQLRKARVRWTTAMLLASLLAW